MSKAAVLATQWWADRLESGNKEAFKAALLPLIEQDLATHGECKLKTEYDPQGHLLTAVNAAGIECSGWLDSCRGILPYKHILKVYPDRLVPKEGYGNWTNEIPVYEDLHGSLGD